MNLGDAFEYAWYCSLNDLESRAAMVECGVRALQAGLDDPDIRELAGADALGSNELLALFFRAAAAVGVSLPDANRARTWCARLANKLDSDGRHRTSRTAHERTHDNLWLLYEELRNTATCESSATMRVFVEHLGHYTSGTIDNYQTWLDRLCAHRALALNSRIDELTKAKIDGVTDLVSGFSYGAVTEEDARKSLEILLLGAPGSSPAS